MCSSLWSGKLQLCCWFQQLSFRLNLNVVAKPQKAPTAKHTSSRSVHRVKAAETKALGRTPEQQSSRPGERRGRRAHSASVSVRLKTNTQNDWTTWKITTCSAFSLLNKSLHVLFLFVIRSWSHDFCCSSSECKTTEARTETVILQETVIPKQHLT